MLVHVVLGYYGEVCDPLEMFHYVGFAGVYAGTPGDSSLERQASFPQGGRLIHSQVGPCIRPFHLTKEHRHNHIIIGSEFRH